MDSECADWLGNLQIVVRPPRLERGTPGLEEQWRYSELALHSNELRRYPGGLPTRDRRNSTQRLEAGRIVVGW